MIIELRKYGKILGLRVLGKELRETILNSLINNQKIVIDFSNVEIISNSFTDELIAKLYVDIGKEKFNECISLNNANDEIKRMILFCINEESKNIA